MFFFKFPVINETAITVGSAPRKKNEEGKKETLGSLEMNILEIIKRCHFNSQNSYSERPFQINSSEFWELKWHLY